MDAIRTGLQTLKTVRLTFHALYWCVITDVVMQQLAKTREQQELERAADKLYLEHRLPTDDREGSNSRGPSYGTDPRRV